MAAAGSQEVHFPALLPKEPYEATGRWDEYGDNIFRLKDRKEADYLFFAKSVIKPQIGDIRLGTDTTMVNVIVKGEDYYLRKLR